MKKLWSVIGAGAVLALLSLLFFKPVFATIPSDFINPCIYNITLPVLQDEYGSALACDNRGRQILSPSTTISANISTTSSINVSTVTPAASTTQTYFFSNASTTANIKASAGRFHGMVMDNASGSKLFVQLHNSTSTVTLGAVPEISIPIGSGNQMIMDASYFQYLQKYFSTGITLVISDSFRTSSPSTAGYASINVMVEYD